MPGDKSVNLLVKLPAELFEPNWVFVEKLTVGFCDVDQQCPYSLILSSPVSIITPLTVAVVVVVSVISPVEILSIFSFLLRYS